jgi:hypothetical protein
MYGLPLIIDHTEVTKRKKSSNEPRNLSELVCISARQRSSTLARIDTARKFNTEKFTRTKENGNLTFNCTPAARSVHRPDVNSVHARHVQQYVGGRTMI